MKQRRRKNDDDNDLGSEVFADNFDVPSQAPILHRTSKHPRVVIRCPSRAGPMARSPGPQPVCTGKRSRRQPDSQKNSRRSTGPELADWPMR